MPFKRVPGVHCRPATRLWRLTLPLMLSAVCIHNGSIADELKLPPDASFNGGSGGSAPDRAPGFEDKESPMLRNLTEDDVAAWSQLDTEPLLSPDGKWLVYIWSAYDDSQGKPRRAPPQLILRSTSDETEKRYSLGEVPLGAARLKMSPKASWIAYTKASSAPGRSIVVTLNLSTGRTSELSEAADFDFSPNGEWLTLEGQPDEHARYELTLHELDSAGTVRDKRWKDVSEFAFDPTSQRLAVANSEGVHSLELETGLVATLKGVSGKGSRTLRWSPRGKSLALLESNGKSHDIVIATGLAAGHARTRTFRSTEWQGFPVDFQITDNAAGSGASVLGKRLLWWRDNEEGVYFEIERVAPHRPPGVDNLVLWHSRDALLPPGKALDARVGARERFLCILLVPEGRFLQLADAEFDAVIPQLRGSFALAYNWRSHGISNHRPLSQGGMQLRDYALVDLTSGKRRNLVSGLRTRVAGYAHSGLASNEVPDLASPLGVTAQPRLSPDGAVFLYLDNNDEYQVIDLKTFNRRNISAGLHARFDKNDHSLREVNVLQGWTAGSTHAVISDGYDLWALPLKGADTLNLTGNARNLGIMYSLETFAAPELSDTDRTFVNLNESIPLRSWDPVAVRTGLTQRLPGGSAAPIASWQDSSVVYRKAPQAPVYIASRTTAFEGTDYFLLNEHWQPTRQLTDLNPERRRFNWPRAPMHLQFRTARGESLGAILYLPIGAVAGRTYPAVVDVYEQVTALRLHVHIDPHGEIFNWLQAGYAVLLPDIAARMGEPGPAALEAVTAAVDAAVATGFVDRNRLGLKGHSFGGYESNYIITQTNLFRAAITLAGLSNLQAFYNATYAGTQRASIVDDAFQPYLSGPWWEHTEEYRRNSPLQHAQNIRTPLLLVHGDRDTSVDFFQSVELFNVLRYLGKSPVVLLQYVGERHGVPDLPDVRVRERQFFDHFLKGAPAPDWWSDGTSYYLGQAPAVIEGGQNRSHAPETSKLKSRTPPNPIDIRVN